MTRENKLALVVGFALILFVGILISDHFSMARNQASANLTENRPNDPLVERRRSDPNLIDLRTPPRTTPAVTGTLAMNHAPIRPEERSPARPPRPEVEEVRMGEPVATNARARAVDDPPFILHEVRPGESLTSISRRYFGDESFVKELAKFNGIADPNTLRAEQRLRIPAAAALVSGGSASVPAPSASSARSRPTEPAPVATYTVQPGDSLSEISQRTLGTVRRWREIVDMNRDVIRDPDSLQVGTVLKLPKR